MDYHNHIQKKDYVKMFIINGWLGIMNWSIMWIHMTIQKKHPQTISPDMTFGILNSMIISMIDSTQIFNSPFNRMGPPSYKLVYKAL